MVQNTFLAQLRRWEMYMAQRGYLVYVQDNRGTSNRGAEFEKAIHGQCGQAEMADQLDRQRVRLLPEVIDYIEDKFKMTAGEIERMERQLVLLSENPASQLDLVSRIYESAYRGKVRNMKGYLVSALKNALGDISLA